MRKFQIPKIPTTTNKSIRFPDDLIEQVEEVIRGKDCNFSAFVIEATRVALENLKEDEASAADGRAQEAPLRIPEEHAHGGIHCRVGAVVAVGAKKYPPRDRGGGSTVRQLFGPFWAAYKGDRRSGVRSPGITTKKEMAYEERPPRQVRTLWKNLRCRPQSDQLCLWGNFRHRLRL